MTSTHYIFTDISYDKTHKLSVAGYLIISKDKEHFNPPNNPKIETIVFQEDNNIRAELRGAIHVLKHFEESSLSAQASSSKIYLYTDCQVISNLPQREQKLESKNYYSQRQNKLLANADLYKEFFAIYKRIKPTIIWLKGHRPKKEIEGMDKYFYDIDKVVRKKLRGYISKKEQP